MKEYERTFKVKSINPFLDYCRQNNYKEFAPANQNRIVFENQNNSNIIARITTDFVGGKEKIVFDFKNVNRKNKNLNVSEESLPMKLKKEDLKIVLSMLDVLEFEKCADNYRTRYVFEKGNVKFEIDDYSKPKMQVVAIEGEETEVEKIFKYISSNMKDILE